MTKKKTTKKAAAEKKGYGKFIFLFWLAVLSPFLGIATLILIASQGKLPATEELSNPKTNLATEVYTSDRAVIGRYYRENRSDIKYENIPQHLIDALQATEDIRFMDHSGVDFFGLARAIAYMGNKGGGSTLTQQLAKMLFTDEYESVSKIERALLQKPKEWIIATRLEKQYTKEEIITLYLNRYDFLNQAVGIKSAAHIYFNKSVDSLNVQESAMLVGMLKNSSLYNPMRREELVQKRRETVLSQMVKYEFINSELRDSLLFIPLGINFQRISHDEGMAPYFRETLRQELKKIINEKDEDDEYVRVKGNGEKYDLYGDGLKVYTTIDSRMQEYAESAVHEHLSGELQDDFFRDLKRRKDKNYPFFNGITNEAREGIMNRSMKQSERHMMLVGKMCPDCKRPAFYIDETEIDGHDAFHCNEEKEGCSHTWKKLDQDSIQKVFETPTQMKLFSHHGDIDTLLSPNDSIKYIKSFLHAGMMSMDPRTGHVKAWVGGINFKHFQYDNVYQMKRQVGSTFKPFVYATALRFGEHVCTEYPNTKICIEMPDGQPQWCPDNSDFEYGDMCSLKYALANSINTITATMIKKYGPEAVIQLAQELGITSNIPAVPSIALGVAEISLYEMVAANAALVNNGVYIEPIFITRIEDKNGNIIFEAPLTMRQAIDEKTAYLTVQLMKGVVDGAYSREKGKRVGTGLRLRYDNAKRKYDNLPYPMAGKTGTTQGNTDGWFMGLTPDLVTGVWVGAQDPAVRFSRTSLGQGANTALPIYGFYMHDVYGNEELEISKEDFEKPENIDVEEEFDCLKYYEMMKSINFGSDPEDGQDGLFD